MCFLRKSLTDDHGWGEREGVVGEGEGCQSQIGAVGPGNFFKLVLAFPGTFDPS